MPYVIDSRHQLLLNWFIQHKGQVISWPDTIDGMYLVNKAKGIHKPQGLKYAVSIRQTLNGTYEDSAVRFLDNGKWTYQYFQEGKNPADRDKYFTNRALVACMEDSVPIGVLIQVSTSPSPRYQVLGLGNVVSWSNGYFEVVEVDNDFIQEKVEKLPDYISDLNTQDQRINVLRTVALRQGQPAFRNVLLHAYENRCAVTGYETIATLEAAHILPYRGVATNHVQNGILLRADIHTLFDLGLLHIEPDNFTIQLDTSIQASQYGELNRRIIQLPKNHDQWPSRKALTDRYSLFQVK